MPRPRRSALTDPRRLCYNVSAVIAPYHRPRNEVQASPVCCFGFFSADRHFLCESRYPFSLKNPRSWKRLPSAVEWICARLDGWRGAMARHGAQWRVVARGHLVHPIPCSTHSTPYTAQMQRRCSTDGRQAPRCWCCRVPAGDPHVATQINNMQTLDCNGHA